MGLKEGSKVLVKKDLRGNAIRSTIPNIVVRVHRRGQTFEYSTRHASLVGRKYSRKEGSANPVKSPTDGTMKARIGYIAIALLLVFLLPLLWILSYPNSELDVLDPRPALFELPRPIYVF